MAIGRDYEQRAIAFLQQHGFEILERNWQSGHKEIDIIARNDDLIVFVEVKASRSLSFGHPSERVNKQKVGHLVKAAQRYIMDHNITDCDLRFDVITFAAGQMEHYPNAFSADQ